MDRDLERDIYKAQFSSLFIHFTPIEFSAYISLHINPANMPTTEELKHVSLNAERDLNSHQAKQGSGKKSDSSMW